ncbi:MMPL family transporter [Blastococcus sp. SYSU DS0552]
MALLLSRLGGFLHRRRLAVLGVWLVVLVGGGAAAAAVSGETTNTFSIPGQESTVAQEKVRESFGAAADRATARVVIAAPQGETLTTAENTAALQELTAELRRLPGVAAAGDPLDEAVPAMSADGTIAFSTVTYEVPEGQITAEQLDPLLEAIDDARASGLAVEIDGEEFTEESQGGGIGELVGALAALVVLTITYGSLALAGMNLLTAGVGVGAALVGLAIVSGFLELTSTTSGLATMLGLAVGIDYALLVISRYRQELRRGLEPGAAIATAVGTAGSAVVTAACTVVSALLGLSVVGIPFLTEMGVAGAGTVAIAALVALTLVPAVLGFFGWRALPRRQRQAAQATDGRPVPDRGRGFLAGWVGTVTRHRVASLLLAVAALGAVAIPLPSLQTTLLERPAENSTQARADQLLAEGFGEGFNGPLTILFEGDDAAGAATRAGSSIAGLDDVAGVSTPVPNADGTAALLTVISESSPTSQATEQLVADLRDELDGLADAQAYVTGATAVSVDVADALDAALPVYLALAVGLDLLLLVLVFRSLLVPLVGVLGFVLTVGASLGASVAVFLWGWFAGILGTPGPGPLMSLVPIMAIGILFGLAMDYQIFLVSRMHEAHSRGARAVDAIRTGFRQAAPVVVAAALIMFAVFAGFFTDIDATIKQLAFTLAVGIAVDAFAVRMVLVPAALAALGELAWWLPSWLRWLPRLDVEGSALERAALPGQEEPRQVALGSG